MDLSQLFPCGTTYSSVAILPKNWKLNLSARFDSGYILLLIAFIFAVVVVVVLTKEQLMTEFGLSAHIFLFKFIIVITFGFEI